jgi:hypothetical protein
MQAEESTEPIVQLTQETIDQIKTTVTEANPDKTGDDLDALYTQALEAELEKQKQDQKPYIDKYKEVRSRADMAGKTDDEILSVVEKELAPAEDVPAEVDFSLFDNKAEEENKPAAQAAEVPEDVKAALAEYELIKADPMFDAYIKARKSGSSDFLEVIRKEGLLIDVKSLSSVDVLRADLMRLKSIDPTITDEAIEEEIDTFNGLSQIEKVRRVAPIREQLMREQEERAKKLGDVFASRAKAEDPAKTMQDFNTSVSKLKDTKFLYTTVDDEKVSKASTMVRNGLLSFRDKEGKLDHDAAAKAAFILSNFRSIVDDARKDAYADGMRASEKRRGNAKSPIKLSSSAPEHRGDTSGDREMLKRKAAEAKMSVFEYLEKHGK